MMAAPMAYSGSYAMPAPYTVTPSHAAAMATAAASGYPASYSMPDSTGMAALSQNISPRMPPHLPSSHTDSAGNPSRPLDRSPRAHHSVHQHHHNSHPASRRVSHAPGAPVGTTAHDPSRRSSHQHASTTAPPPSTHHHQQPSPEMPPAGSVEESPLYVNAKQFHRILKRRSARQKLEEQLRLTNKGRKPYLHESRHNHAMRRPRGPGGRFLTADEVSAMEKKEAGDDEPAASAFPPAPAATMTNGHTRPGAAKRKASSSGLHPSATIKRSRSAEADAPDDDDDGSPDDE